jgi:uncharacterized protein (DUF58 family)
VSAEAQTALATPVAISLRELIAEKPAGERIKLSTPRIKAAAIGGHLSPFKGRGVEFDESRPYQEGDDLRTMDWRVTARSGKPHTKVFREERNRPVLVWLDTCASMLFATRGAYKAVVAARMAALIAWSGVANGDQLGGLVFNESAHQELRPRLGRRAALRLLELVAASPAWTQRPGTAGPGRGEPARGGSGVGEPGPALAALERLARVARPGSLVFLLSDFAALDPPFERRLRQLASHCDVQLVQLFDAVEAELPPPGRYRINVGKRMQTIDTSDEATRERYRAAFEQRRQALRMLARQPGMRFIACATHDDPALVLMRHYARR